MGPSARLTTQVPQLGEAKTGLIVSCRKRSSNMGWGEEAPAEVAAALPHYAQGPIVKGFGRGSTELGFPTANFSEEVIEALPEALIGGIYWGLAQVDNGQVHDMVMSIGWNPFYENKKRAMETHIVHKFEDADLYDRQLKVIILGFIRPEQNFDSLEALIDAIRKDIKEGKKGGQRKVGLNIEQTLVFNRYMYNLNLCIDNISLPRSITNRNKMLPMQIFCTTI